MCRKGCLLVTTMLCAILLVACSGSGKKWDPNDYTAKSGDTVYSIAWRYELDPEEFAAWNNLGPSKWIKAGQRLHTRKPSNYSPSQTADNDSYSGTLPAYQEPASQTSRRSSNEKWVKVAKGDTLYSLSRQHDVSVPELAQLNQLKKPYLLQPGQTIFLKPLQAKSSSKTTTSSSGGAKTTGSAKTVASTQTVKWPKRVRWQRPVNGKIIKRYDRRRNDSKGIDIAGTLATSIVAAADGKVVYSGDGLISYGNLIIIKHNKTYLSAYAYNQKLLVKEGDVIKAGQKISEMGRKDNLSPRLHFEIRKNGKPVDPLKYLPW